MIYLHNNKPKILVIGDLIIDQYLWGSSERISPEAPVPIVNVNNQSVVLGGAGNVINNLKALGAEVDVISVIGKCSVSDELLSLLSSINIDTNLLIVEKERISSKKTRIISAHQQVVRYDEESVKDISLLSQKRILSNFSKNISKYDCLLLSDYGKGVLTNDLTQQLISIAKSHSIKTLVDPKGSDFKKYKGAYLLTPNKNEASEATGINIVDDKSLNFALKELKEKCKLRVSLITLSEHGVAIYDDNGFRTHPTQTIEVFDVTGAGDTVLASLGFAVSCKLNIDDAVRFANLAAGVVIGKIGSATATLNEIINYESNLHKSSSDAHIKTIDEIKLLITELKSKGNKIVFTNGCFDLIHSGHVRYIEVAKSFGDILIIGINSDSSVIELKGKERPINSEKDRAYIIAALEAVDYVVIFDENSPYNLIKAIRPDTLVKGGDYKNKDVVGQDIAGQLKLVDFIEGKSTSNIIEKIKSQSS